MTWGVWGAREKAPASFSFSQRDTAIKHSFGSPEAKHERLLRGAIRVTASPSIIT